MDWGSYLLGFAVHAAQKSKDPSTKVGAVLVGPNREVRLSAYNGPPRGVRDLPERFSRENGEKYRWINHAEANLISFAARHRISTDDCTVYVTHQPCSACARLLITAGVKRVVYGDGSAALLDDNERRVTTTMFEEAGVTVFNLKDHK